MKTEWKVGEIGQVNGEWYQCVNQNGCCNCAFYNTPCHLIDKLSCDSLNKKRKEKYIFKKLEKVGEPFERNGYMYQEYKAHIYPLLMSGGAKMPTDNGFAIIIKQNKDMEEKKIQHYDCFFDKEQSKPNPKPFDLEAAKAGKPVCTRNGRRARIICFDAKFPKTGNIVTLVEKENGEEVTLYHYDDGHCSIGRGYDLMMSPEKKEGWINIYKGGLLDTKSYSSKEEAVSKASQADYIDTIKIEWEE